MTVFDLEKDDQGDWFSFFDSSYDQSTGEIVYKEPEENAAQFRIRSMGPFWEKRRDSRKKQYKMVVNPKTRQMERVGYYDDLSPEEQKKENDDAWDYAITGIIDAYDATGNPIECTRDAKLKLVEIPVFLRFISRVFQILSETGVKRDEDSEKNLGNG